MATTKIADIIKPERLASMVPAILFNHMSLLKLGFAKADYNNVKIDEGGTFAEVPSYDELTGVDTVIADDSSLIPGKITTSKDVGVVCHRGAAWGSRDLAKIISGSDPMKEIAKQMANFWGNRALQTFISVLKGVFAATGPLGTGATNPHVIDVAVTSSTPAIMTATSGIDVLALLGQYFKEIDGWIMHSKVYLDAERDKLITYKETVGPDDLEKSMWRQPYFLGKPVIISDDVPVDTAVSGYYKYTTYGLAKGSLYFGTQKKMNPETDRDVLAKEDVLSCDMHFVPHLKLVKWNVSTENPTNAQLATAANWSLIATNHKYVKAIAMVTN